MPTLLMRPEEVNAMDEGYIVREYKAAKKPAEQIGILAELNDVPREAIEEILARHPESGYKQKKPGRAAKTAEAAELPPQLYNSHAMLFLMGIAELLRGGAIRGSFEAGAELEDGRTITISISEMRPRPKSTTPKGG